MKVDDPLGEELIRLARELEPHEIPLIVGGGYGLFLKTKLLLESKEPTRVDPFPSARSTEDLDLFLLEVTEGNSAGSGIVFHGIEHDGNIQDSEEEVDQILEVYSELIGRQYTDKNRSEKPLELSDFLFIAPYNAQVRALERRLPAGARVGSVDKFQGQEAPVCVLSLCSSFGEYGSRGIGFILNQNRINVAISRSQCTAIVVADPRIATTSPSSIETMKLLNLFCKLLPFRNAG